MIQAAINGKKYIDHSGKQIDTTPGVKPGFRQTKRPTKKQFEAMGKTKKKIALNSNQSKWIQSK